jgi:lactoylglutathione lyase
MRQYTRELELRSNAMIPIRDLFEAHLTVKDLQRSMRFFGDALGLELAQVFPERKVAFYWVGRPGDAMLGLWEAGMGPQRMNLHVAFSVDLDNLLQAAEKLRKSNIVPLNFAGEPTDEPIVFAWMPAASIFFNDPDGNLLEFLSMLPDAPQCNLGVVRWSRWKSAQPTQACT